MLLKLKQMPMNFTKEMSLSYLPIVLLGPILFICCGSTCDIQSDKTSTKSNEIMAISNNAVIQSIEPLYLQYDFTQVDRDQLKSSFIVNNGLDTLHLNIETIDSIRCKDDSHYLVMVSIKESKETRLKIWIGFIQEGVNSAEIVGDTILVNYDTWGIMPEYEVEEIGKCRIGLFIYPGFTRQGITTQSLHLFSLTSHAVKNILTVESYYEDNQGQLLEEYYSLTSKYKICLINDAWFPIIISQRKNSFVQDQAYIFDLKSQTYYPIDNYDCGNGVVPGK